VHSDSAACVRCGKTMRIQMDKASEEAVKAIKKLFD
jgi:phosphoribosylformylglycinamidine (FGAM) synthase PurS component